MIDMARRQILPAVVSYTKTLADTCLAVKEAGANASVQLELLNQVSDELVRAKAALGLLEERAVKAASIQDQKQLAFYYKDEVSPAMEALRKPVDALEMLVDREVWPMPTYADLMFEV